MEASTETLKPVARTSPIDIPSTSSGPTVHGNENENGETSSVDYFLRNRQRSIVFDDSIRLDSGERHPMDQSPRNIRPGARRTGLNGLGIDSIEERLRSASSSLQASRRAEAQLPQLETNSHWNSDEPQTERSQPIPMHNDSNSLSPATSFPTYDENATLSPTAVSPRSNLFNSEPRRPIQRASSQPWRNGTSGQSTQGFWSRQGSMTDVNGESNSWLSRRDTTGSYRSSRSNTSAASSFLRAFHKTSSTSSSGPDDDDAEDEPESVPSDTEGQNFPFEGGEYIVGRQINAGGFSIIREATLLKDGHQEKAAVKIVRRKISGKSEAENERYQDEFEHEYELWRLLRHPHIIHLDYIIGPADAVFCFMPLNAGGTLWDFVVTNRQPGIPLDLAKSYAYQLGSALHYLHLDARAVHRDLKLENCLLDLSEGNVGKVRVCDFGMAEWLSSDDDVYRADQNAESSEENPRDGTKFKSSASDTFLGGSHHYVAPEIIRKGESDSSAAPPGQRAIISPALDMWAFGVCVYTLVVGYRPFEDKLKEQTLTRVLRGRWDPEKLERGGAEVRELVTGCLMMDENERWNISRVMKCSWFSELAATDETMQRMNGAWRL